MARLKLVPNPSRKHRLLKMYDLIHDVKAHVHGKKREDSEEATLRVIEEVSRKLMREDRIVWFLRLERREQELFQFHRLSDIHEANESRRERLTDPEQRRALDEEQHRLDRWMTRLRRSVERVEKLYQLPPTASRQSTTQQLMTFGHYVSNARVNGYRRVLNLEWRYQSPSWMLHHLPILEREDQADQKNRIFPLRTGETVLSFKDGFKWVMLDRGYCELEGKAMSHCGNVGAGDGSSHQRILSLRSQLKGREIPHLTFVWHFAGSFRESAPGVRERADVRADWIKHAWGYLGEMKGYANTKPASKYHPHILALLRHPMVQLVAGGGYASEANFNLQDLDEVSRASLKSEKPQLWKVGELAKHGALQDGRCLRSGPKMILDLVKTESGNDKVRLNPDDPNEMIFWEGDDFYQMSEAANLGREVEKLGKYLDGEYEPDFFKFAFQEVREQARDLVEQLFRKNKPLYQRLWKRLEEYIPEGTHAGDLSEVVYDEEIEEVLEAAENAMHDGYHCGTRDAAMRAVMNTLDGTRFWSGGQLHARLKPYGFKLTLEIQEAVREFDGDWSPGHGIEFFGEAEDQMSLRTKNLQWENAFDDRAAYERFVELIEEFLDKKPD